MTWKWCACGSCWVLSSPVPTRLARVWDFICKLCWCSISTAANRFHTHRIRRYVISMIGVAAPDQYISEYKWVTPVAYSSTVCKPCSRQVLIKKHGVDNACVTCRWQLTSVSLTCHWQPFPCLTVSRLHHQPLSHCPPHWSVTKSVQNVSMAKHGPNGCTRLANSWHVTTCRIVGWPAPKIVWVNHLTNRMVTVLRSAENYPPSLM